MEFLHQEQSVAVTLLALCIKEGRKVGRVATVLLGVSCCPNGKKCLMTRCAQAGQAAHVAPDAAGAVQKELAGFLQRCPGGVVALDNAQKLHPALLPVFINALSEQGSFEVPPQLL